MTWIRLELQADHPWPFLVSFLTAVLLGSIPTAGAFTWQESRIFSFFSSSLIQGSSVGRSGAKRRLGWAMLIHAPR